VAKFDHLATRKKERKKKKKKEKKGALDLYKACFWKKHDPKSLPYLGGKKFNEIVIF
jgi:hypothetical protein